MVFPSHQSLVSRRRRLRYQGHKWVPEFTLGNVPAFSLIWFFQLPMGILITPIRQRKKLRLYDHIVRSPVQVCMANQCPNQVPKEGLANFLCLWPTHYSMFYPCYHSRFTEDACPHQQLELGTILIIILELQKHLFTWRHDITWLRPCHSSW